MTINPTLPTGTDDWRKPAASGENGNCVTVRGDLGAVRDSKNPGPVLRGDLQALVAAVKAGRLTT